MKKKKVLFIAGVLSLAMCRFVSANQMQLKKFVNAAGDKVFYPVLSDTDADIPFDPNNTVKIPDNVKIGDIFPSEHGYERVIAISEDGAFVTELTEDDMVKNIK